MSFPALFLPGQLTDERLWAPMVAAMPPGLLTPHYIDLTRGDTVAAYARHALSGPPEEFILIGLSLGGYVSFEILRQSPHRVRGLILFNTSARSDDQEKLEERERLKSVVEVGKFAGVTNKLMPTIVHPRQLGNRSVTDTVMQMAAHIGQQGFLAQQNAIITRPDSRDLLPHIPVPTLIIGGDSDQRTPPELQQEIADQVPGAEFHLLDRVGHLAPLEEAVLCAKLITIFLQKNFTEAGFI
ncbi:MAG TPA: alpha/beta fold hydrolase [Alphaproteobacteria bacterium]|nr:alpha/beta hydrolase [Rhodospirillaceae bacterium]HRJ12650.1 alpha/beta fold hydrolase [Alphaproteobacteria bacterium]